MSKSKKSSPCQRAIKEGLVGDPSAPATNPHPNPNPIAPKRPKRTGRPGANTPDWAPVFICALTEGMSITDACTEADVHPTTVYQRRRKDEEFRKAWNEAADIGTRLLEQEAQRRAYHGTIRPI